MWTNPFWGSLKGPDAEILRAIFQSLQDWTRSPSFGNPPNLDPGPGADAPQALKVFNDYIQSSQFQTGVAGWQIKADGTAEFNGITVRGTIQTAVPPNRRIEISTSNANKIMFYAPTITDIQISSEYNGFWETLTIRGPDGGGGGRATLVLDAAPSMGVTADQVQLVPTNASSAFTAFDASSMKSCYITSTMTVRGSLYPGGKSVVMAPATPIFARAGSRLWLNTDNTALACGEAIVTMAFGAGIRIGQRTRGETDLTQSWAIYGTNDELRFYNEAHGDYISMRDTPGGFDWRVNSLPNLIGDTLTWSPGNQIGYVPSRREAKEDIRPLDRNPVWDLKPVRFKWKRDEVANADEINELRPDGTAGLMADEVSEVAPDAVTRDADGNPRGLDLHVLVSYLVKAVQELRSEIRGSGLAEGAAEVDGENCGVGVAGGASSGGSGDDAGRE